MKTRQSVLVSFVVALVLIVVGMPASAILSDDTPEERLTKLEKRLDEEKAAREKAEKKLEMAERKLEEQTILLNEFADVVRGFCTVDPATKRLKPSMQKMIDNPEAKKEFENFIRGVMSPKKAVVRVKNFTHEPVLLMINSDSAKFGKEVPYNRYLPGETDREVPAGTIEYRTPADPKTKTKTLEPGEVFEIPIRYKG